MSLSEPFRCGKVLLRSLPLSLAGGVEAAAAADAGGEEDEFVEDFDQPAFTLFSSPPIVLGFDDVVDDEGD